VAPQGWMMVLALHAALIGVVPSPVLSQGGTLISARELAGLLGTPGMKVVDVRSPEEYQAGHIPGALSLHVQRLLGGAHGFPEALAPVEKAEAVLGFPRVRVYDRSLVKRGNRPDLPMEGGRANHR